MSTKSLKMGKMRVSRDGWAYLALLLMILVVLLTGRTAVAPVAASRDSVALNQLIYLPIVLESYPPDISGRVTFKGAPAAAIALDLYFNNGSDWSVITSTTTDSSGAYRFSGIASLQPGQEYYVRYGPNESNPDYVYSWYGPLIKNYTSGDSVSGGVFDIADVRLLSPAPGANAGLPVTFTWEQRDKVRSTYRVALLDLDNGDYWVTNNLGDVGSVTINTLPPEIRPGRDYGWYVEVYQGPDSFGESFMLNDIRFKATAVQHGRPGSETSLFTQVDRTVPASRTATRER
jgi:hypothetical protein